MVRNLYLYVYLERERRAKHRDGFKYDEQAKSSLHFNSHTLQSLPNNTYVHITLYRYLYINTHTWEVNFGGCHSFRRGGLHQNVTAHQPLIIHVEGLFILGILEEKGSHGGVAALVSLVE
jgi:hypothetical protein